jgi:endonuclease YncB( thermonuclease family)
MTRAFNVILILFLFGCTDDSGKLELARESLSATTEEAVELVADAHENTVELVADAHDNTVDTVSNYLENVVPVTETLWHEVERVLRKLDIPDEEVRRMLAEVRNRTQRGAIHIVDLTERLDESLLNLELITRELTTKFVELSMGGLEGETSQVVENQVRGVLMGLISGTAAAPRSVLLVINLSARMVADFNYGPEIVVRIVRAGGKLYVKITTEPPEQGVQELGSFLVRAGESGAAAESVVQVFTFAIVTRLVSRSISSLVSSDAVMLSPKSVRGTDGDTLSVARSALPARLRWMGNPREGRVRIRLRSIDTRETVHPHKPVQAFGREATENANTLLASASQVQLVRPTVASFQRIEARVLLQTKKGLRDMAESQLQEGLAGIDYRFIANLEKKTLGRHLRATRGFNNSPRTRGLEFGSSPNAISLRPCRCCLSA